MRIEKFPGGKIRFEIEELGPIRDSVIDFKPFLLFSGESNTGKSYAAMAVYHLFFMLKKKEIMEKFTLKHFDIEKIEKDLKTGKKVELVLPGYFFTELEKLYNDNIARFLGYMLGNDNFSCKVKLELNIPGISGSKALVYYKKYSGRTDLFLEISLDKSVGGYWKWSVVDAKGDDFIDYLTSSIQRFCIWLILGRTANNFFLPPARGAFSGLSLSMYNTFSVIGMYREYLEGLDRVRFIDYDPGEKFQKQKETLEPLLTKLINGKIRVEGDREIYTVAGSGIDMPLTAASSSVKELSPLHRLLNRVNIARLSICIEEPEAHLHPELQRSTAMLLSYIVNKGGLIQATTHSDFFINQINNLLKLHFIKNRKPDKFEEALKETGIGKDFVLDPEDVGAYYFGKKEDGACVEKLEITEKGLPMKSFDYSYDKSIKQTRYLREALTDDED